MAVRDVDVSSIERGMTKDAVLSILGEPDKRFRRSRSWLYVVDRVDAPYWYVQFDEKSQVVSVAQGVSFGA